MWYIVNIRNIQIKFKFKKYLIVTESRLVYEEVSEHWVLASTVALLSVGQSSAGLESHPHVNL